MDPQGNSADMVGAHVAGARSWVDVFEGTVDVAGARICDVLPGLDLVAAGDESRLAGVEQGLVAFRALAEELWPGTLAVEAA